jgi:parallel beta-helix repeat protein
MNKKLVLLILISFLVMMALLYKIASFQLLNSNQESISQFGKVHNLNTGLNYATIQEAINAPETKDGHSILVDAGVYREYVVVNKSLTIFGENRTATIFDAKGMGTLTSIFSILANNVKLHNFTVVNGQVPYQLGVIGIKDSSDCIIESLTFSNCCNAIVLVNSWTNIIKDCNISIVAYPGYGISRGVYLYKSCFNKIEYTEIRGEVETGIEIEYGWCNIIRKNRINTPYGTSLRWSRANTISENYMPGGIVSQFGSCYNLIVRNVFSFFVGVDSGNTLYHNCFITDGEQIRITENGPNTWDNGIEGNYWSDYIGQDLNHDGIGDTYLPWQGVDGHPLMGMFSNFTTSSGDCVEVISNSTISSFEYFQSNNTIKMYVSGQEDAGFCRICIPIGLMSPPYHIIIDDGQTPVLFNRTVAENQTHKWIYFAYQHSTHKIVIIPEFASLIIMPLFMIATLLAAIVYKRNHR